MPDSLPPEYRELRPIRVNDLSWMLSLAYKRYGPYDPGKILAYLADALASPKGFCWRSDRAFIIASLMVPVWRAEQPDCHIVALCAEAGGHWQAIKLLRASMTWAREHRCRQWRFGSETNHDISALAKYVGAHPSQPSWECDLGPAEERLR